MGSRKNMATFDLVVCGECGCRHKVPIESLGRTFACSKCGAHMRTEGLPTAIEADALDDVGTRTRVPGSQAIHGEPGQTQDALPKRRLGEMLIEKGLIDQSQLDEALRAQKEQGGKVAEILISMGFLDMREFVDFLSKQPGVASIDLFNYQIPQDILGLIPSEFARKHEIIPLDKLGKHLTVAMACPLDTKAITELEQLTNMKVKALLCSVNDVRVSLNRYYPAN